ncbi:MAG: hypothetical protein QXW44_01050 [Pyrobaculum sp.]
MDPALIEARYQRALFKGSLDTLLRDFKLRYGERWEEFYKKSEDAYEKDIVEVERVGEDLIKLVEERIDDVDTAALYSAYGRNLSIEKELEIAMELLGRPGALEKLLKWGLVMHFTDDVVTAPPYLAKLLLKLTEKAKPPSVELWEELYTISNDGAAMALLEGLLTGDLDIQLHQVFYNEVPKNYVFGKLAVYREEVGLVVNPVLSAEELLEAVLQIKERRADTLAKALSLHGEYEFNKEIRCGVHYLTIDGTFEKSGVVAICPWLTYSKSLWRRRQNYVVVLEGKRPRIPMSVKVGVIFIKGGEAEVVKPSTPSKIFDYLVDLLYSVGFLVTES